MDTLLTGNIRKRFRKPTKDEDKEESDDKPKARWRYNTSKYCHSCGAGNHPSKKCKKKKSAHKNKATFKNLMGGCTDFC